MGYNYVLLCAHVLKGFFLCVAPIHCLPFTGVYPHYGVICLAYLYQYA